MASVRPSTLSKIRMMPINLACVATLALTGCTSSILPQRLHAQTSKRLVASLERPAAYEIIKVANPRPSRQPIVENFLNPVLFPRTESGDPIENSWVPREEVSKARYLARKDLFERCAVIFANERTEVARREKNDELHPVVATVTGEYLGGGVSLLTVKTVGPSEATTELTKNVWELMAIHFLVIDYAGIKADYNLSYADSRFLAFDTTVEIAPSELAFTQMDSQWDQVKIDWMNVVGARFLSCAYSDVPTPTKD